MNGTPMEALAVMHLHDIYVPRGSSSVLTALELTVQAAESVAITGPSGSGKSTLLGVMAGLVSPSSGQITVSGTTVNGAKAWSRTRLHQFGIVFQGDEFLPELSLLENVCLPSMLRDSSQRLGDLAGAVNSLFERLGIDGLQDRLPSQVSVGQLQRASVARAALGRPAIILADEPTSALDQDTSHEALTLLLGLASEEGSAICVVTHDRRIADLCDRHLHLTEGRLQDARTTMVGHA